MPYSNTKDGRDDLEVQGNRGGIRWGGVPKAHPDRAIEVEETLLLADFRSALRSLRSRGRAEA